MTIAFRHPDDDNRPVPFQPKVHHEDLHLPPQNTEMEQAVIASMLLDPTVIDDVMSIMDASDCYRSSHEILCRTIFELHSEGKPVDSLTVEEALGVSGELAKIGGIEAILDIQASEPSSCNARYYASITKTLSRKRAYIELGNKIVRDGYDRGRDDVEIGEAAERGLYAISDNGSQNESKPLANVMAEVLVKIDRLRRTGILPGVRTGFELVDSLLGGCEGGQFIVVASRPSMGKTAFGLQWAMNVAERQALRPLVFSLEMPGAELASRMLSLRAGVDSMKFRTPTPARLKEFEIAAIEKAQYEIASMTPIEIDDEAGLTATRIASRSRRYASRHGLGIVIVDYLQFVQPESGSEGNRQEQVAAISRRFKVMARELNVPVVVLSQLSRKVEDRDDKTPRLSDLRESGQIEQDADAVVFLYRPEYYNPNDSPGMAKVIVAKNRNGMTGSVSLQYSKQFTRFADLSPEVYVGPNFD